MQRNGEMISQGGVAAAIGGRRGRYCICFLFQFSLMGLGSSPTVFPGEPRACFCKVLLDTMSVERYTMYAA